MLRHYSHRQHAILPAMGTTRLRRDCVLPMPAMSPAAHRFQSNSCFVTILLCRDAAASRVGKDCCSLPCPPPATLEAHSPNFVFRFSNFETRHSKYEIGHP